MGKYIINGGNRLCGDVQIQGSKNSSLAVLIAAITVDGVTVIKNLPAISDVSACLDILRHFGCEITYLDENTVKIDTKSIEYKPLGDELTVKLRASGYLLGALLSRFSKCPLLTSGGCNFGDRPIDLHLKALSELGATVDLEKGELGTRGGIIGNEISFPLKTVGATVNAIIASTKAKGKTVIKNAAKEPHIVELASYLNACGANITGAGSDIVTVIGVDTLKAAEYEIQPDMIEAGTFLLASLATNGEIRCIDAPVDQLRSFFDALKGMGAKIYADKQSVWIKADKIKPTDVVTAPFPDFPTDLQPQIAAILGLADGESEIKETVFKNRFSYATELKKLGLDCAEQGDTLKINGVPRYSGANIKATDLRGGAAAVIAALNANGKTTIENAHLIERGYSNFVSRLTSLGAEIKKG